MLSDHTCWCCQWSLGGSIFGHAENRAHTPFKAHGVPHKQETCVCLPHQKGLNCRTFKITILAIQFWSDPYHFTNMNFKGWHWYWFFFHVELFFFFGVCVCTELSSFSWHCPISGLIFINTHGVHHGNINHDSLIWY